MKKHICLLVVALLLNACGPTATDVPATETRTSATEASTAEMEASKTPTPFELRSPGFEPEGMIPERFSCNGEDLAPELMWSSPPEGTQSLALVFNDPDAGSQGWVHWVLFNLPPDLRGLPEGQSAEAIPAESVNGANSWGTGGYGGPCPPPGSTHRYVFSLYALDTALDLPEGSTRAEVLAAIEGHVLAEAELAGSFRR